MVLTTAQFCLLTFFISSGENQFSSFPEMRLLHDKKAMVQ